jgi:hypothetical protein
MNKLKDRLKEWTDWDRTSYEVGVCLGFWSEFNVNSNDPWNNTKGIFWVANPLGDAIHDFTLGLVKEGILEVMDDSNKFRWNPEYKNLIFREADKMEYSCPCSKNCCAEPDTYNPEHECDEHFCESCYIY